MEPPCQHVLIYHEINVASRRQSDQIYLHYCLLNIKFPIVKNIDKHMDIHFEHLQHINTFCICLYNPIEKNHIKLSVSWNHFPFIFPILLLHVKDIDEQQTAANINSLSFSQTGFMLFALTLLKLYYDRENLCTWDFHNGQTAITGVIALLWQDCQVLCVQCNGFCI